MLVTLIGAITIRRLARMRLSKAILANRRKQERRIAMNVLTRQEQLAILNLLVEGNSLRSITRLTGVHRTTIMKLMVRVGNQCREMLDRWMRNLTLHHLEV